MISPEQLVPGDYVYSSELPLGCKGYVYRLHRQVLDVPSYQQKVLVECLGGKDKGLWFVCSVVNFCRRYSFPPPPQAEPEQDVAAVPATAARQAGPSAAQSAEWGRA